MEGDTGFVGIELFAIAVGIAAIVALVTRRSAIPYSVALVVVGLGIAIVAPGDRVDITPELILAVLIPGLVFEAAFTIDLDALRRRFGFVLLLAAPGVLITAFVVAVVVSTVTSLDFGLAFLFGAIVSATDPVAVIELFKRIGVPSGLATTVEAESLLNDGTGVVLFSIALAALSGPIGIVEGIGQFGYIVVASMVIGLVGGFLAVRLMALADDHLVEVMISVVAAYGTYLVADRLHDSGIIATVLVGLVMGNPGRRYALKEQTREALDVVWGFVAFLLTALTFLLVGLAISPDFLITALPVIAAGYFAITIARAGVVYLLIGGVERLRPGPNLLPMPYLHVMFWSGLRGAIAIALALALPADLPQRDLLTGAAYGIVLITLLVQGTTATSVIRRAGAHEAPPATP